MHCLGEPREEHEMIDLTNEDLNPARTERLRYSKERAQMKCFSICPWLLTSVLLGVRLTGNEFSTFWFFFPLFFIAGCICCCAALGILGSCALPEDELGEEGEEDQASTSSHDEIQQNGAIPKPKNTAEMTMEEGGARTTATTDQANNLADPMMMSRSPGPAPPSVTDSVNGSSGEEETTGTGTGTGGGSSLTSSDNNNASAPQTQTEIEVVSTDEPEFDLDID